MASKPHSPLPSDLLRSGAAVCASRAIILRIRARSAHAEVQWIIRNSCRQIADARECMNRLDDSVRRDSGHRRAPTTSKPPRADDVEAAARIAGDSTIT